ncbi:MAG: peptidoglycan editing factor PgeF [Planktomarina sp.]
MPLNPITHPLLDRVTHGFFTREGGASSGIFEGLNCGLGSTDQMDMVHLNRSRVTDWLQADHLQTVHQFHSADVAIIDTPVDPVPKADALVTRTPGIALGVLTADCQPVLFCDAQSGVIGAAHAGWKGALSGVLEATIDAMVSQGAARANIHAVIGPCISQRAYEVGPEFLDQFLAEDPNHAWYFAQGQGDRYMFDLPSFGLARLRQAGIGAAQWCGHCTYSDSGRFFSFRKSVHDKAPDYGRLIACIKL